MQFFEDHAPVLEGEAADPSTAMQRWCEGEPVEAIARLLRSARPPSTDRPRAEVARNWDLYLGRSGRAEDYDRPDRAILEPWRSHPRISKYYAYQNIQGLDLSVYSGPDGGTSCWMKVWFGCQRDAGERLFRDYFWASLSASRQAWDASVESHLRTGEWEDRLRRDLSDVDPSRTIVVTCPLDAAPLLVDLDDVVDIAEARIPREIAGTVPATPHGTTPPSRWDLLNHDVQPLDEIWPHATPAVLEVRERLDTWAASIGLEHTDRVVDRVYRWSGGPPILELFPGNEYRAVRVNLGAWEELPVPLVTGIRQFINGVPGSAWSYRWPSLSCAQLPSRWRKFEEQVCTPVAEAMRGIRATRWADQY